MSWQWVLSLSLAVGYFFAGIALVHALLRTKHPQAALGWTAAIVFLPFLGTVAYILFGISRVDSHAARLLGEKAKRRSKAVSRFIPENKNDFVPLHHSEEHIILRVAEKENASMSRLGGNHIQPLFNGDEAYPQMLEAIRNARHEVFLCTYIFEGKQYGRAFADALSDAHRRGVNVRLLVDGMGTFLPFSRPWRSAVKAGVPYARFIPPHLFPPQISINLRNHRKVLICDAVAFTGGMNISDAHVLASSSREKVQDIHFSLHGPIVGEMREAFLLDWAFAADEEVCTEPFIPRSVGNMDALVIMDGPGTPNDPIQDLFCGVISCARKSICICTPYFLPPRELISALICAASRGVDVKIILPGTLDHAYVGWASNHTLSPLLESGVKIFRQPGPFAHTKLLLIDNNYVCFGSTNMDPRSLSLNFELNVEVYSEELGYQLYQYCYAILARSQEVTMEDIQGRSLLVRLRDAAVWIFSPYL